MGVVHTGVKFSAGIVDNGAEFTAGVNNTGGHIFPEIYTGRGDTDGNLPPVSMALVMICQRC